jgi:hypothetical protein
MLSKILPSLLRSLSQLKLGLWRRRVFCSKSQPKMPVSITRFLIYLF